MSSIIRSDSQPILSLLNINKVLGSGEVFERQMTRILERDILCYEFQQKGEKAVLSQIREREKNVLSHPAFLCVSDLAVVTVCLHV